MDSNAPIRFNADTLEARLQRFEQGLVDADIEGIERDPDGEALLRDMIVRGVQGEERRARLKAYLATKRAHTLAAE